MKTMLARCKTRALVLGLCSLLPAMATCADDWQAHAAIRSAAEEATRQRFGGAAGEVRAVADALDSRLRLRACEVPLVAELPPAAREAGRVTAEVRCPGAQPWRLYVPVRVAVTRTVVVTATPLERGKVLAEGDVILAQRDVDAAPAGYLTSATAVLGQRLRRNLPADTVLSPGLLDAPVIVRRGQDVTLQVRSGPVVVQMAGVARDDGALGQTIAVANSTSKKVVQGIVRNEKTVEIRLP